METRFDLSVRTLMQWLEWGGDPRIGVGVAQNASVEVEDDWATGRDYQRCQWGRTGGVASRVPSVTMQTTQSSEKMNSVSNQLG